MNKPTIELIKCDSGDWKVLRVNCGEDYEFGGHSIPDYVWVEIIELLGYKVEQKLISDEDMENSNY